MVVVGAAEASPTGPAAVVGAEGWANDAFAASADAC